MGKKRISLQNQKLINIKFMKKIQIKIDKKARACAIYISGKLIDLSIPFGWQYFYIFGYRIDSDDVFIAF